MTNTEKQLAKEEKKKQRITKNQKNEKRNLNSDLQNKGKPERKDMPDKKEAKDKETALKTEKKETSSAGSREKKEKEEDKKTKEKTSKKTKIKKTEAIAKAHNFPISPKYSFAICRFIKNKEIEKAISDLEEVINKKRAVPMKGEIAHRKNLGKYASGSGRYPKKATEHFIKLLKSLKANADYNGLEEPIISEAVANIGNRPYGKFGRWKRKRAHILVIAKEKKKIQKKDSKKLNKKEEKNNAE